MREYDLFAEIDIDLGAIQETLAELEQILARTLDSTPSRSDMTAAATYLAQCYNGIESILKRVVKHAGVPMPAGHSWHMDLLDMFRSGRDSASLPPILCDDTLFTRLTTLRKFRHIVLHGYAIHLKWEPMRENLALARELIGSFLASLKTHLGYGNTSPFGEG